MSQPWQGPPAAAFQSLRPRLVLHQLKLSPDKQAFLEELGVEVCCVNSVRRGLRALAGAKEAVLVVDVGAGSNAPELLVKAARRQGAEVLACARFRHGMTSRARQLGVSQVLIWPEGGFAAILDVLESASGAAMRRVSPRASVNAPVDSDDFRGTIVNISATGALVKTAEDMSDTVSVELELTVGETSSVVSGDVVWRELGVDGWQVGLRFSRVTAELADLISEYVRRANVVGIPREAPPLQGRAAEKVRVRKVGGRRVDYMLFEPSSEVSDFVLWPPKAFFVDWTVGEALEVRRDGSPWAPFFVVRGRRLVEPDRIDSRVQWYVAPRSEPDAAEGAET